MDLWERLRRGYALPDLHHPRITSELNWFVRHPDYLERAFTRAEPYLHFAISEAERRGIPLELALLPVVESAFDPFAFSPLGPLASGSLCRPRGASMALSKTGGMTNVETC